MQEATRTILEWIYKLLFSEHAHSFRPGVQSALRYIKKTLRGASWFLQFIIQKSDDMTLVQRQLMRVLSERIEDKCFMDILKHMFKVGIVCMDIFADEEIPRGSLLSLILGKH
jgi:retron-type reverse transcriptase